MCYYFLQLMSINGQQVLPGIITLTKTPASHYMIKLFTINTAFLVFIQWQVTYPNHGNSFSFYPETNLSLYQVSVDIIRKYWYLKLFIWRNMWSWIMPHLCLCFAFARLVHYQENYHHYGLSHPYHTLWQFWSLSTFINWRIDSSVSV